MNKKKKTILEDVTNFYLSSGDYNGKPLHEIEVNNEFIKQIFELVKEELIYVNYGDRHPNPHILAFEPESMNEQLKKISIDGVKQACLYPTSKHLETVINKKDYRGKPFELMLALGEAQLSFKSFDLTVLEQYRNDPRYEYECDDIHGNLYYSEEFRENGELHKKDSVFIQHFSFSYTPNLTKRAVAVFLRYLTDLTPEHQQHWFNKILDDKYFLHPSYAKSSMGSWDFNESIFNAFIEELNQINTMTDLMGKPSLFRKKYSRETRPKDFSFLIRPTLKEFNDFIQTLDKLMSDNLNKAFFKGDISLQREDDLGNRKVKITEKGTISLLEEWLQRVQFQGQDPKVEAIKTFRKVRKLRQKPAHAINENEFNQKYFTQQRKLVIEAYKAIRALRLILANHPRVINYKGVPEWLYKGEISTF
ncbi:MAG: AAA family ATPase [Candidatus Pacebacteria bacterium]|nr:AAA family ATPase [Candidatus Paceibacterota bacterium]MBT4359271.1 AAA family ATPase [Candidatus Paceibacterota bacterium]MBT4680894.1 AAA family ATPase [Candidatus Paceibacterota bacterium]MBT6898815.1 AAA family ATPase [Candidatus Paceibacterota bacterium]MBT7183503.1 AAA family ATPase [Candidatus Paceibacterota bacterium]